MVLSDLASYSVSDDPESTARRTPQLAKALTTAPRITRYMMRLMNMRPEDGVKDGGAALKQIHAELRAGALDAAAECVDFSAKKDDESQKLAKYYADLNGLLMTYLTNVDGKYNEKLAFQATVDLMSLMKEYEIDNMGARLDKQKEEAILVLAGGPG